MTNRNNKRYVVTDRVNRRLKEMSDEMNGAPPPPMKSYPQQELPELPDIMWGKAIAGITAGDAGGVVTLYRYDAETDTRTLLTDTIVARTYGSNVASNTDVILFRVPGFWLAAAPPQPTTSDTLERFVMQSNWVGGVAAASFQNLSEPSIPAAYGIVEDPLGIFTDILGVGGQGLSIRTRYGRHYVIQAKCDQVDVPPVDPVGACEFYVEGVGSQCFVTTSAMCALFGGTYDGDGTSCP